MVKKREQYPNPTFESSEEEDKYWASHNPLEEGYEGKLQTVKQKRASFLSVRLTEEELTQLRDMAVMVGVGPSTYARMYLKYVIEQGKQVVPYNPLYRASNMSREDLFRTIEK